MRGEDASVGIGGLALRLYWIVGSLALAWWCRDSEVLSALLLLQARIGSIQPQRHREH